MPSIILSLIHFCLITEQTGSIKPVVFQLLGVFDGLNSFSHLGRFYQSGIIGCSLENVFYIKIKKQRYPQSL